MSETLTTRIGRLGKIQDSLELDAFLFTTPSTITCFSGYSYYFEIGSSPFQILPAALIFLPEGESTLILADNESFRGSGIGSGIRIKPYESYVFEKPLDFTARFLFMLNETIHESRLTNSRIGIEQNTLPYAITHALKSACPRISWVDVSEELSMLKATKDPDEIDSIQKAVALCDLGQASVVKNARAGMTELELFSLIRTEMEARIGTRLPIMLDLVSGARTEEGGGIPSNTVIREGDLVLSDLTPCLNGYWGDTCNTLAIGKPTAEQLEHFKLIEEALQSAIDFIKPGIRANEVDRMLRKHLSGTGEYSHHSGHGVGTSNHEEPRIVPYNKMILEKNMVIALEPAIYTNGYGIRLEHLIRITENGCEKLSAFRHCFVQES